MVILRRLVLHRCKLQELRATCLGGQFARADTASLPSQKRRGIDCASLFVLCLIGFKHFKHFDKFGSRRNHGLCCDCCPRRVLQENLPDPPFTYRRLSTASHNSRISVARVIAAVLISAGCQMATVSSRRVDEEPKPAPRKRGCLKMYLID